MNRLKAQAERTRRRRRLTWRPGGPPASMGNRGTVSAGGGPDRWLGGGSVLGEIAAKSSASERTCYVLPGMLTMWVVTRAKHGACMALEDACNETDVLLRRARVDTPQAARG